MERIYVTVRARPLSAEDTKSSPWRISGNSIYLANQSAKFEFDRIFGEESRTREVYEARIKEIVASAVRGFNGTVFVYGQTSSGKTHTMRGSETEPGVIPLAVHDIFQIMQENSDTEFLVRIAYMEIYNEEINDLLNPEHRRLQIHEGLERGIFVAGLKEEIVACPEQVLDLMQRGESHRHIGETNMNLRSSRSHTIFRVTVESREKADDSHGMDHLRDAVRVSVLNLVDLAGSERAAKTGAEGVRLKEGSHINKSLMILGTVIKKLSEGTETQGGHVPYRDSKLTRILQPALGGNANTAIICNITLAQIHTEETKSSLQFASRAIRVTNCACVNEILTDAALLFRQRKEIEELRARLLASHSEHWEQEILSLRNTLLQSELEKERIAQELEEEKKAKAQLEKRLQEQTANDQSMYTNKHKRQKVWWSGHSTSETANDVTGDDDMDLPLPFEDLVRESVVAIPNIMPNKIVRAENADSSDSYSLPDAHALLHVTSRRKVHCRKASSPAGEEIDILAENTHHESECVHGNTSVEAGCIMEKDSRYSSVERNPDIYLLSELEAIPMVKQCQDQENMIDTSMELITEIISEIRHSNNIVEEFSFFVEDTFQSFSYVSKTLLELEVFASQDVGQFMFVANSQKKLYSLMKRKSDELETEKHLLLEQTTALQKQIQELKFDAAERERALAEVLRQHESEKDELCHQILALQKEVSRMSSSSLTKEKETLRKELEKTKSKLKDAESKLKNTIQDKVRLESEKAHAEREIKRLHGQRAILERDVSKHNSLARCETKPSDFSKSKGHNSLLSQTLQGDYEQLGTYAFELETQIASLEEKMIASIGEKEEAFARYGNLESELEALSNKLNTANSELKLMAEEIASLNLKLDESQSHCQRLETSYKLTLSEKEEMAMQLTDALLEFEAKNSMWATTEKALVESGKKSSIELAVLSEDLLKVRSELEPCRELCKILSEKLTLSEENAETKRENRSSEIAQLRNDLEQFEINRLICEEVLKSKIEELSLDNWKACDQVNKLQKHLSFFQEREGSYSQSKMDITSHELDCQDQLMWARKNAELAEKLSNMEVKAYTETQSNNIEKTKLRMRLRGTQARLGAFRGRYMEAIREMERMNRKFEAASSKLKEQLASYGSEILYLKKQFCTKQ